MSGSSRLPVLPLFFHLEGVTVLIVGGGEVARRKAEAFAGAGAGAKVTVVAPNIQPAITGLSGVMTVVRPFVPEDLTGCSLAVLATDRPEVQDRVAEECRRRGILFNRCDRSEESTFVTGAVVRIPPVTIGLMSDGLPTFTQLIRERIEGVFSVELRVLGELLQEIRPRVKRAFADPEKRREFLRRWSTAEVADRIARDGQEAVRDEMHRELAERADSPEDPGK